MAANLSRLSAVALVAAALFQAAPAQARECLTGWITHVDLQNDTITLDSGKTLLVSGDINLEDLSEGTRVKLMVMRTDDGPKAVSIAPVMPSTGSPRPAGRV